MQTPATKAHEHKTSVGALASETRRFPAGGWCALFIVAATTFAYWPSVAGGILWDDPAHITVPALRSWHGLWRILTEPGATQEFYPVLHGAFWVQHKLWGETLPLYHLLNIVLHAGSGCLLAVLLQRLARIESTTAVPALPCSDALPAAAWFSGLLFALHPVGVESVAWMTELKNTLSGFFCLAAVLAYVGFTERRGAGRYALATILFVLALGAKTATIVTPPALLVLLWWRRGTIAWRRDVWPLVPWFVLAVAAGLITIQVETHHVGAKGGEYALHLGERAMLACRILWFYFATLSWPRELIFFYPRWDVPAEAMSWWPFALLTIAVTAGLWVLRTRARGPLAAWLLFVGVMFPVIGFLNVFAFLFSYVADHFQYQPYLVFCGACGGGLAWLAARLPERRRSLVWAPCAVICLVFGVLTFRQSALYVDNETLFGDVVRRNPASWMAHQILGTTFAKSGRGEEAMRHFREVIRLKPDHPDAYHGLGLEFSKQPDRRQDALTHLQKAVDLRPHYVEARYNLGVLLAGDPARRQEALRHLDAAVELAPDLWQAREALGNLLAKDPSSVEKGLEHLREAVRLNPGNGQLHRGVADALARLRRLPEAIAAYQTALGLNPDDAVAHFHLADVLASQRARVAEAITHYEKALALDPALGEAHLHYAMLLAQFPDRQADALSHAEAAVRLAPHSGEARNALGIFYAQLGRLADARREWEAALANDPRHADAAKNLQRLRQMQGGER